MAWGPILYVDDLVTAEGERSKGYGRDMLRWLAARARERGCRELHLDSGVHRADAHRFYETEHMVARSKHFVLAL